MEPTASIHVASPALEPLSATDEDTALREIGAIVARRGYALVPPYDRAAATKTGGTPRVFSRAAIRACPLLRAIAGALPRELVLVVVAWDDGAACITAVPREAGEPPPRWMRSARAAALNLPTHVKPPTWWPLRPRKEERRG